MQPPKARPRVLNRSRYEVVQVVLEGLGWAAVDEGEEDWDVLWVDGAVGHEAVAGFMPWQRVNHFPGMHQLARKNCLARNL